MAAIRTVPRVSPLGSSLRLVDSRAFGILGDLRGVVGHAVLVEAGSIGAYRTWAVVFLCALMNILIAAGRTLCCHSGSSVRATAARSLYRIEHRRVDGGLEFAGDARWLSYARKNRSSWEGRWSASPELHPPLCRLIFAAAQDTMTACWKQSSHHQQSDFSTTRSEGTLITLEAAPRIRISERSRRSVRARAVPEDVASPIGPLPAYPPPR
jgi:hypothetical protein